MRSQCSVNVSRAARAAYITVSVCVCLCVSVCEFSNEHQMKIYTYIHLYVFVSMCIMNALFYFDLVVNCRTAQLVSIANFREQKRKEIGNKGRDAS